MAIIRKKELKTMSKKQLEEKLLGLREELMKLNAQRATGVPPQNPGRIKSIKRTISQILTLINQKGKEVNKKA